MNQRFFELSEDRRLRIVNAGLEVFAKNEYTRAGTEEIGRLGGISKGLLFYYFHNKKSFYLYLHDYALERVTRYVVDEGYDRHTDFFELCEYAARKKQQMLQATPYLFDFLLRAFYSEREDVSDALNARLSDALARMHGNYFKNIDASKFKPGVDLREILEMMTLLAEGYVYGARRAGRQPTLDEFMGKFERWSSLLRRVAYQEAFGGD